MKFLQNKLKKFLTGKYFGEFKNIFKGGGVELKDIRDYNVGDDVRSINRKVSSKHDRLFVNVLGNQKDADVHVFLDINKNWEGGYDVPNKIKVYEMLGDLFLFVQRYSAKMKCITGGNKLNIKDIKTQQDIYNLSSDIEKHLRNFPNRYESNLSKFLKYQKSINKSRLIIIVSDFLGLSDDDSQIIKYLGLKNEFFLLRLYVYDIQGQNYDLWSIKKSEESKLRFINI